MSASQQLQALGGPVEILEAMQATEEATLRTLLEERRRMGLDIPDTEVDMIVRFFKARNRRTVSQGLLDAYCRGRYEADNGHKPERR